MFRQRLPLSVNFRRLPWQCLTWSCIGLGAVGAVLPLLPTTPFLLVAAWAAPKGSPRLGHWLHSHPRFGPMLEAWQEQGAVATRAKVVALVLLTFSWATLFFLQTATVVLGITALLFIAVAGFLLTRPSPRGAD